MTNYSLRQLAQFEQLEKAIQKASKRYDDFVKRSMDAERLTTDGLRFGGWTFRAAEMADEIDRLKDRLHMRKHEVDKGGYTEMHPCPGAQCEILRNMSV